MTLLHHVAKFVGKLDTMLRVRESNCELRDIVVNFGATKRQRSSTVCILRKYKNSLPKIWLLTRKGSIISRVVTLDLVYSYKKLTIVPKE